MAGAPPDDMSLYRLTPKAKADLRFIWSYIALDSTYAADRVEDAIYEACAFIAQGALRGHVRSDLTDLPVRFWTIPGFPKYVIVYDPDSRPNRSAPKLTTLCGSICHW